MTAKEVYNIMKALEEITGPEESVKLIKKFVEYQLDKEIKGITFPDTVMPLYQPDNSPKIPITPVDGDRFVYTVNDFTINPATNPAKYSTVTFSTVKDTDISWTADYVGDSLDNKEEK